MGRLLRAEDGTWTIELDPGDDAGQDDYTEALPRYLTALDPAFSQAQATSEFEFIHSLLRVSSLQDAGWHPFETTERAIPAIARLHAMIPDDGEGFETARHLQLWTYGHILEAAEPYGILADLLAVADGGRFTARRFPRDMNLGDKIQAIERLAGAVAAPQVAEPLREIWDRDLRNSIFHADYALHGGEVRIRDPARVYRHEEIQQLVNRALAYLGALVNLRRAFLADYTEPRLIPVHPGFSPDPGERAVVIVREGQGAIGLKHALTRAEIAAGGIAWRMVICSWEEAAMFNADPELAFLPAEHGNNG